MSFIVNGPSQDPSEPEISSGEWWPPVMPGTVRTDQRIDASVTQPRLRAAIIEAIASVNGELTSWRVKMETEGHTSMANVPSDKIDDVSINVHRYHRAVGCLAKVNLIERMRDIDITGDGQRQAETLDPTIDDLRRDASWAINDILGIGRTTVELI